MKKIYSIVTLSVLALIVLQVVDGLTILKIGTTRIDFNMYPKFLLYIFAALNFTVYFIANNKFYTLIKNQKYKYWKMFSLTLLVAFIADFLIFILHLIIYKFQPSYDPNFIFFKELGIPYSGPKYEPIKEILIHPFIQLYYYISAFKFFAMNIVIYFMKQPILLSFLIPFLIIILRWKKNTANIAPPK